MKLAFTVAWSEVDGEYVGTCEQFPSLSHLDPSETQALLGIVDLVSCILTANESNIAVKLGPPEVKTTNVDDSAEYERWNQALDDEEFGSGDY